MERASIEMDLEEWELLDLGRESGKDLLSKELRFDPREILDANYFVCPSEDSSPAKDSDDEVAQGFKDICVVPPMIIGHRDVSQVYFKKLEADEFANMKVENLRSNPDGVIMPMIESDSTRSDRKEEAYKEGRLLKNPESGEDEEEAYKDRKSSKDSDLEEEECKATATEERAKHWWEDFGLGIWRWRLNCSIGVAAATVCMFLLGGGRQRQHDHQNLKLQFQIYDDDKRIMQVMQQAARLNQALVAVRNAPMVRANISFGGYYDGRL